MTFQRMTNDIIDWRRGVIDEDELRRRWKDWDVKREDAAFCVNAAREAGIVKEK